MNNGRRFTLEHAGAKLQVYIFDDWTGRWIFSHYFMLRNGARDTIMVNELSLVVDYDDNGLVSGVELSMHVVIPARLGQRYFAGMDISPGAKTHLTFEYARVEPSEAGSTTAYQLAAVVRGVSTRIDLRQSDPGAALRAENPFPFPVPDRIELKNGLYRVPFLAAEGQLSELSFPACTALSRG